MSVIFNPSESALSPSYIDGLQSSVAKKAGISTNAAVFTTIGQVDILPNTFSAERQNSRIQVETIGRFTGVNNKSGRWVIDAAPLSTGLTNVSVQTEFSGNLILAFRNNQLFCHGMFSASPGGTGLATMYGGSLLVASFDPTILHSILLQFLVVNAGESATCDWIGANFR